MSSLFAWPPPRWMQHSHKVCISQGPASVNPPTNPLSHTNTQTNKHTHTQNISHEYLPPQRDREKLISLLSLKRRCWVTVSLKEREGRRGERQRDKQRGRDRERKIERRGGGVLCFYAICMSPIWMYFCLTNRGNWNSELRLWQTERLGFRGGGWKSWGLVCGYVHGHWKYVMASKKTPHLSCSSPTFVPLTYSLYKKKPSSPQRSTFSFKKSLHRKTRVKFIKTPLLFPKTLCARRQPWAEQTLQ